MRLIDTDALYETLCNVWYRSDSKDFENAVFEIIQKAPDAQPEQKKGKWLPDTRTFQPMFVCSNCMTLMSVDTVNYKPAWNYCPNCGAEMRGERE